MATAQLETRSEYVAQYEFHLNLDGGKTSVLVHKGDSVFFDGIGAECKGHTGAAPSLRSMVGNWIVKKGGTAASQKNTGKVLVAGHAGRSAIEGRSGPGLADVSSDTVLAKALSAEVPPVPGRKVVENSDEFVVRKVSRAAYTDAETKNTSGVEIGEDTSSEKRPTVHEDQRVAKETHGKKADAASDPKRRTIMSSEDSEGTVVKKVSSAPARSRDEITEKTKVVEEDQVAVKATAHGTHKKTDIGSSTQTKTSDTGAIGAGSMAELMDGLNKSDTVGHGIRKRVAEQSDPTPQTKGMVKESMDDQGGVVFKKTAYRSMPTEMSAEGIETTLSVGTQEESEGIVTVSGGGDDIVGLEAKTSSMSSENFFEQDAVVVGRVRTAAKEAATVVQEQDADPELQALLDDVVDDDSEEDSIVDLMVDGVAWDDLHWKKKVQLIGTLTNPSLLKKILEGAFPAPLKVAAEKRLNALG